MRILMLSDHCCIRVIKQTNVLIDAGHMVAMMHRRVANNELIPSLAWQTFYDTEENLRTKLAGLGPQYDVIHVHNEPSRLVTVARECCPTAAIVYDCHDLDMCRHDLATGEEARAFFDADAAIFPSHTYEALAIARYKLAIPTATVFSWLTGEFASLIRRFAYQGGMVYEGSCRVDTGKLLYLDYRPVAQHCHDNDIPLAMIQADQTSTWHYQNAGAATFGPFEYVKMLSELTRYGWGVCGPGTLPSLQWVRTVPNKLFEYVAAGLPVVCWPDHGEVAQIVRESGVGFVLANPQELTRAKWQAINAERERYVAAVVDARQRWRMENQLPQILDIYNQALLNRKPRRFTADQNPLLSIVIATVDRFDGLIRAIDSARMSCAAEVDGKWQAVQYEIIVVDGGSTDRTADWCLTQPDIVLIQQGKRLGAVAAYNAGFRAARGKYVAHLNDDCVVHGPILHASVSALETKADVGQVALPFTDPGETEPRTRVEWTPGTQRNWTYANFGVTPKALGDKLGWWGEYQFYAGDAELSLRIWDCGLVVAEIKGAGYIEHGRAAAGRQTENNDCRPFREKWAAWKGPEKAPEEQHVEL